MGGQSGLHTSKNKTARKLNKPKPNYHYQHHNKTKKTDTTPKPSNGSAWHPPVCPACAQVLPLPLSPVAISPLKPGPVYQSYSSGFKLTKTAGSELLT